VNRQASPTVRAVPFFLANFASLRLREKLFFAFPPAVKLPPPVPIQTGPGLALAGFAAWAPKT
jgi:hypothetical protein